MSRRGGSARSRRQGSNPAPCTLNRDPATIRPCAESLSSPPPSSWLGWSSPPSHRTRFLWNINGTGQDAAMICWLEVKEEGGQLRGMFLNRVGNPAPLGIVRVEGDELVFRAGSAERPNGPEYARRLRVGDCRPPHGDAGWRSRTRTRQRRSDGAAASTSPATHRTHGELGWRATARVAAEQRQRETHLRHACRPVRPSRSTCGACRFRTGRSDGRSSMAR